MKPDMQFIESLQSDMTKIANDVSDLLWNKKMFDDFVGIVKNNPELNYQNAFYDFVRIGFLSASVLAVGRLIDGNKKTISLVNVLLQIVENPDKITKDWYANKFVGTVQGKEWGANEFERNFGKGNAINPIIIQGDIDMLRSATGEIKAYRDKRYAHYQKGNVQFKPSRGFDVFNKAVETIDKLAMKYYLLLFQVGYSLMPTDVTDYRKIFYIPWIKQK